MNDVNVEDTLAISDCMLSTIDNPYNPCDQFDEWFAFDYQKGYCTCAYLARIATTSDSLSEYENNLIIESAMKDIIDYDPLGIYVIMKPGITPKPVKVDIGEG